MSVVKQIQEHIEKLESEANQLREENAKLVKALERITTVTADGSTPAEWDYSTGGAGHAQCRRIAASVLSELRGGNPNE